MGQIELPKPARKSLRLRKPFAIMPYSDPLDDFRKHLEQLGYLGHDRFIFTVADFSPDIPWSGIRYIKDNGTYRSASSYCASELDHNRFIFGFNDNDIYSMTEWEDGSKNSLGELCSAYEEAPGIIVFKNELFIPHSPYEYEFKNPDKKKDALHGLVPIIYRDE